MHPGDLLYLPRGVIHEAISMNSFSTHITISVFQKHNVKTLISSVVAKALEEAFVDNIEIRRGLPVDLKNNFGSYIREIALAPPQPSIPFLPHPEGTNDDVILKRKRFTG